MTDSNQLPAPASRHPIRKAILRGLGILMPPLLTIVLFLWAWSLIVTYVLAPVESLAGWGISLASYDVQAEIPSELTDPKTGGFNNDPRITRVGNDIVSFQYNQRVYTRSREGYWVGYYPTEYIRGHALRRSKTLPYFVAGLIAVAYLLGKFVAAGVGHFIVGMFDRLILQLPLISNVYSAVKQVTDFVFVEREIEFNRVVAIEYPRRGIWSVGFVTGEGMADIRTAADEPVLSVLMPTSPMPVTGFTITVLKSEAVDLNVTIDQAIQFIVSCGVVVPLHQQVLDNSHIAGRVTDAIASHVRDSELAALESTAESGQHRPERHSDTQPSDSKRSDSKRSDSKRSDSKRSDTHESSG